MVFRPPSGLESVPLLVNETFTIGIVDGYRTAQGTAHHRTGHVTGQWEARLTASVELVRIRNQQGYVTFGDIRETSVGNEGEALAELEGRNRDDITLEVRSQRRRQPGPGAARLNGRRDGHPGRSRCVRSIEV